MDSATETPTPPGFVIPEDVGYAMTAIATCEATECLTKLEQVNLDDIDPNDRVCAICQEEFRLSEDVKLSHPPVKTVCGHIFGKRCLIKWLDPLCFYGLEGEDDGPEADENAPFFQKVKTSCPACRRVFFPEVTEEVMESLSQRLSIWDAAYASAGVPRSEKEEHTRKYLWEYVNYCHSVNEQFIDDRMIEPMHDDAQQQLLDFAIYLKAQTLTPEQEKQRQKLERIGERPIKDFEFDFEKGSFVFDLDLLDEVDRKAEETEIWERWFELTGMGRHSRGENDFVSEREVEWDSDN